MKILPVTDAAFKPYGRIVEGYDVKGILAALENTPLPENVVYVPREETLHAAPGASQMGEALFGGMPYQLGYCNGHNTKLNCLEYHRDSEFNLGTKDFILLLAKQDEMEEGKLNTGKVKAFRVPAGVMIECYATTLHYAPCQGAKNQGFQVMVALPLNTNTPFPAGIGQNPLDRQLWARNKWLIAHPDTKEAQKGAVAGLQGENIDIMDLI
ncbi:MAG: DUF4867 family protein [Clostridiales bacterium]|nr:DUF4867 family protein [Clostridiales bacterium]